MDWTNSAEDAAGIEDQIRLRQMLAERPWLANQTGAFLSGLANTMPGQGNPDQQRLTSNYRSEAPASYRAGAYGFPAAVTAGSAAAGYLPGMALGAAGLAHSASQDPGLAEVLRQYVYQK